MHAPNPSRLSPPADPVDTSPLLAHSIADHLLRSRRLLRHPPSQLRGAAAWLIRQASSRRVVLRETSVRVRENAAEQLEERQSDWAYSKPVIVLDVLWNLALVAIVVAVLGLSAKEKPDEPLRLWIIGYGLQCLFHVGFVIFEYKGRREESNIGFSANGSWRSGDSSSGSGSDGGNSFEHGTWQRGSVDDTSCSVAKHLESANTMFSFIWWIIGFYWVTASGQNLTHDSPQLYWLCISFLSFDVVFVIICVVVACLIGLAICCCLPCIIGILYAMTEREGATKEEIDQLPMFKFCRIGDFDEVNSEVQESLGGMMIECNTDTPAERNLSHEDAECCICLSAYDDGTELRELPCHHHFHCMCIDKWLSINATCPLCKLNILKAGNGSGNEEA